MKFQCSTFVEIEQLFSLQEARCNYNKTQVSPYDPTRFAIHSILRPKDDILSKLSNCGQNSKKIVPFDDIVFFIDDESIVTYVDFDGGIVLPSTLKLLEKSDRSTENGITFPDPVKSPSAFPAMINITVLMMNSVALISF